MDASLRVTPETALADIDPGSTPGSKLNKKTGAKALLAGGTEFGELQEKLFAESTAGSNRSLLLVLQAMDTAGKGGILGHVMGHANPQGIRAFSFKAPTDEERAHDFLWRIRKHLPSPGEIGVFDRSHYEDVLIHRVRGFSTPEVIDERYGLINEFEQQLVEGGTTIIKVMLHISPEEQKARLAARLKDPNKHWKYKPGDVDERKLWPAYMEAYQVALQRTSTDAAPWFVVPADHKWYARLAVQDLLLDSLRSMQLDWPVADYDIETEKARVKSS